MSECIKGNNVHEYGSKHLRITSSKYIYKRLLIYVRPVAIYNNSSNLQTISVM